MPKLVHITGLKGRKILVRGVVAPTMHGIQFKLFGIARPKVDLDANFPNALVSNLEMGLKILAEESIFELGSEIGI